ncbi:uncharacterized protein LOC126355554 [Schistocerca gregaria]|uniref:uncharacterized protein LOC126355554 n=1 Tax=Schistocerca gregaria TaxID=7010 RepID=UPI00211DEC10|nr:uncharacterized protein LOC126355554 [Schistocerca gregaria]
MVKIGMEARQVWGACAGVGSHWALGVLLLLGLAAEDWSGPAALLSLAIAFTVALLTATCGFRASEGVSYSGGSAGGDGGRCAAAEPAGKSGRRWRAARARLPWGGFLQSWWRLLGHAAAVAASARALSACMAYIGGSRWLGALLGRPPPPVAHGGDAGPDPVALAVAVVPALLCALGLESSWVLRLLLNAAVAAAVAFFVSVGSLHADPAMWAEHGAVADGLRGVASGAALCSYGFLGLASASASSSVSASTRHSHPVQPSRLSRVTLAVLLLASHCAVATLLAMLVHYRGLRGSAVPLLQVFEVRDVDWARVVMAACSVLAFALVMVEESGPMHAIVVSLAEAPSGGGRYRRLPIRREDEDSGDEEWSMAAAEASRRRLALQRLRAGLGLALGRSRSEAALLDDADADAGAPSGASTPGASSLARLLGDDQVEVGAHTYTRRPASSLHLNGVYAVPAANGFANGEVFRPVANGAPCHVSTVLPANGHSDLSSVPPDWKKFSRNMAGKSPGADSRSSVTFPRDLFDSVDGQHSVRVIDINNSDDRLAYCKQRFPIGDSDVEDEEVTSSSEGSSEESSSTDIDAIVAEYKEKLQVATATPTTPGGGCAASRDHAATAASGRRVQLCLWAAAPCAAAVAAGVALLPASPSAAGAAAGLGAAACAALAAVVARQPPASAAPAPLLCPWLPAACALACLVAAAQLLPAAWPSALLWLAVGECLRYQCATCRIALQYRRNRKT